MAAQITSYGKSGSIFSELLIDRPGSGPNSQPRSEKGKEAFSILVIDNQMQDLRYIRPLSKWTHSSATYRVEVADDCGAALEALVSGDAKLPHLIIVDMSHQGQTCVSAIQTLKQNSRTRRIPVVMWTLESNPEAVQAGYAAGANCVARKPQTFEEAQAFVSKLGNFWFSVASLAG